MRILVLDEFLSMSKDLLGDAKNVVVATYNRIEGYPDGLTTHKNESGKRIRVMCGGGMFNGFNFMGLAIPDPDISLVQATKDAGVDAVVGELSEVPEATFVVLYAGSSRLEKMVNLGASLAEKGAKVALLSCGCDRPERFSDVDEAPGKNNIIIVMPQHPGRCDSEYHDLATITATLLG